jgi:hypothetical protein
MMPAHADSLDFPTTVRLARADVESSFQVLSDTRASNRRLHYRVTVPRECKVLDAPSGQLSEIVQIATLGIIRSVQYPAFEVQVDAVYLKREVEPCDWVHGYLDGMKEEIVRQRTIPSDAGDIADVLTRRTSPQETSIHRWVAVKNGSFMLLAQARCKIDNYAALADVLFIAASSIAFLHPRDWPLSERLATLSRLKPLDFVMFYPESWKLQQDSDSNDQVLSLNLLNISGELVVGTLLFVVLPLTVMDPLGLCGRVWQGLEAEGYLGELTQPTPATPTAALLQRLELVSTIERRGVPHEIRLSVATVGDVSMAIGVVGPARTANAMAWATNKRAYRLLVERLKVKNQGAD